VIFSFFSKEFMTFYLSQPRFNRNLPFIWLLQVLVQVLLVLAASPQPTHAETFDDRCRRTVYCPTAPIAQSLSETESAPIQPKIIKFRLNDLTGVSEWIRAEVTGNQVKLLHTVVAQSGLSKFLTSASPLRVPFPIAHTWYDHPTSRIIFQPAGCQTATCQISGSDSVTVPAGSDIYQGQFTLEYTESGWLRTITFKLPQTE
jgi:hypothetical protein